MEDAALDRKVNAHPESPDEPYLSVVATARNDNHGGDLNRRMQIFVGALVAQCERHGVDAELVLVDWNPPANRVPLAEVLQWPDDSTRCCIRVVQVPHELHAKLDHSGRLPLFQMIAKNVGIRRARGRFVLATNVDLLFSDELMSFIAERRLQSGFVYRTDRYDVRSDIELGAPVEEQLADCRANLIRICRREGTYEMETGRFYRIYENLGVPLWLAPWTRLFRLADWKLQAMAWRGGNGVIRALRLILDVLRHVIRALRSMLPVLRHAVCALRPAVHVRRRRFRSLPAWLRRHNARVARRLARERDLLASSTRRVVTAWRRRIIASENAERRGPVPGRWHLIRHAWLSERARLRLHTNACGDFTLASREDWERTGAYPELELFSMHLDSLFLYQAHYSGVRERFLPFAVYHLEHDSGFKPDDKSIDVLNDRLERKAIPQISNEQFLTWVIDMYRTKRPVFVARTDWGLAHADLPETTVVSPKTMDVVA